jgi:transcriptional regulator of NAD metabolism
VLFYSIIVPKLSCTHARKNLTTRCVRNRLVASLSTSCNNAVIYQVATRLSLTLVELQDNNRLLEQLVTSLLTSFKQAVDNLSTSWEQAVRTHPVDKLLEQHCYKCTYLDVYLLLITNFDM